MKKTRLILAVAVGMGVSLSASAQIVSNALPGGGGTVTPNDCALLSQNVVVTLSANVGGAYACSLNTNTITAGACSTAGATRTRSIPCSRRTIPDPAGGPDIIVKNVAACPDVAPAPPAADVATITGRVFYIGNSGGGQINASPLGDALTTCTGANIIAAFEWPQN